MGKRYTDDELDRLDRSFQSLLEEKEWTYLVIDNSIAMRKTLVKALQTAGCLKILEAKDGMEGIMALKDVHGALLTLVELNVPVLDGIQFLQQLHTNPQFRDAPVIIMSAESRKDRIIQAVRAGAAAYLKKPFPAEALIEKLKSLNAL